MKGDKRDNKESQEDDFLKETVQEIKNKELLEDPRGDRC